MSPSVSPPRRWTLRTKLLLYLVALHVLLAATAVFALRDRPVWLLAAEGLFAVSAWLGVRLVRALFVPLELLQSGAEMIGEGDFSSTFRSFGQPEMDALIAVYNRMLESLREERLLRQEQNLLLERVLQASPAGVVTLDFDGRVSLLNPRAAGWLGAAESELRGQALASLQPLGAAWSAVLPGASALLPLGGGRRLKVSCAELFDRGFPRRFYVVEELTEELRASERAAYGKLIRMMSHEINNSAGAVGSLLDSLRAYGVGLATEDRRVFLDAIAVAIQRLERLRAFTNGFADVVRLPEPDPRPCDLTNLVRELQVLWQPQLDARRIACTVAAEPALPPVAVDRNQIEQVLVNVLKNAQEAIGTDGRIAIALRRAAPSAGAPAGVRLTVRDNGCGLPSDPSNPDGALFEPFYSTKSDGRGLGLTLVREILARHGLAFALENAPGGGAEFSIDF